jgi:hypothetical protein
MRLTMTWNDFRGRAKRLDDIDLPRIGHRIGVGEDEIHAFMEVESRGSGFDKQGRPAMLFEPHVFYRELSGSKRDRAVREGLAYADWRPGKYPADSYPRLKAAMAIDETAALRSASWGLGQILGTNHRDAGYATPQAMVRAFMEDEEDHLEAMVRFLQTNRLDDDLKAHRWVDLARGYNGPQHAKHDYAGRLARAYAKWRRIKDTPWMPDMAATETEEHERDLPDPPPVPVEPAPKPAKPKNTPISPKSRTAQGTGASGVGGAVVTADGLADAAAAVEKADGHISAGTWLQIAVGVLIIAGAGYAMYARWRDGGGLFPWEKK